jgi:hypothetical protein
MQCIPLTTRHGSCHASAIWQALGRICLGTSIQAELDREISLSIDIPAQTISVVFPNFNGSYVDTIRVSRAAAQRGLLSYLAEPAACSGHRDTVFVDALKVSKYHPIDQVWLCKKTVHSGEISLYALPSQVPPRARQKAEA